MSSGKGLTMLGDDAKGLKIHDLVKAPANTPWAKERQQSWDASYPATVYSTPEMTTNGQPCSAVTVILRTKGGGHQVVLFVDISTIPETMSTAMTFMPNGSMQKRSSIISKAKPW